jgi:TolA-binding protein
MKREKLVMTVLFLMLFLSFRVYSQETGNPKSIFTYAEELLSCKEYGMAMKEYLKLIYLCSDNQYKDDAQYKIGLCLFRNSTLGPYFAIEQWQKLIDKYPDSKWVAEAKKKIKSAKTIIHTTYQYSDPPVISVKESVANRYIDWGSGFLDNSKKWSSEANYWVYNKEELKKAFYWFDKVIAEFPDLNNLAAKAQIYRGNSFLKKTGQPDYKGAVEEYLKVVDKYPDTVWANEALQKAGDIYSNELRSIKKAIEIYQKLVDRNGNDADNYYVIYGKYRIGYLK